jgi:glycosyltransferase involved in cell wall biosynthesis/multidrug transporter EmrE-like cation transporter
VTRLRSAGHEVTVLSPPDGDGDVRVPFFGGRPFFRAARMGRRFDRIVVHFQPSLYYRPRRPLSKVMTSLALWWLAMRRPQTELVVHEADQPVRWRPDYALLRLAFARAGRVWFHTKTEQDVLEQRYRIRVRGGQVSQTVATAHVTKAEARRALGLEPRAEWPVFVCPGFLHPGKGFDRAVEAFAALGDSGALYIVGSVREPTPENLAHAEALQARCREVPGVTLVEGYQTDEDFDRWVGAADWVVLPYRRSWSSGVLARAQAVGTPAIVSAVGGLAEQAAERDMVFEDDEGLVRAMKEAAATVDTPAESGGSVPPHHEASDWDPDFQPPIEKKGRGMLFAFILISVVLAALAQLTLKHGMTQVTHHGDMPLDLKQPVQTARRVATNAAVWAGLLTFVASAAVWIVVLSRASLSFAYPFVSMTYILILLFDRLALHEPVSALRWGGVAFIIAGILLISRTHQPA